MGMDIVCPAGMDLQTTGNVVITNSTIQTTTLRIVAANLAIYNSLINGTDNADINTSGRTESFDSLLTTRDCGITADGITFDNADLKAAGAVSIDSIGPQAYSDVFISTASLLITGDTAITFLANGTLESSTTLDIFTNGGNIIIDNYRLTAIALVINSYSDPITASNSLFEFSVSGRISTETANSDITLGPNCNITSLGATTLIKTLRDFSRIYLIDNIGISTGPLLIESLGDMGLIQINNLGILEATDLSIQTSNVSSPIDIDNIALVTVNAGNTTIQTTGQFSSIGIQHIPVFLGSADISITTSKTNSPISLEYIDNISCGINFFVNTSGDNSPIYISYGDTISASSIFWETNQNSSPLGVDRVHRIYGSNNLTIITYDTNSPFYLSMIVEIEVNYISISAFGANSSIDIANIGWMNSTSSNLKIDTSGSYAPLNIQTVDEIRAQINLFINTFGPNSSIFIFDCGTLTSGEILDIHADFNFSPMTLTHISSIISQNSRIRIYTDTSAFASPISITGVNLIQAGADIFIYTGADSSDLRIVDGATISGQYVTLYTLDSNCPLLLSDVDLISSDTNIDIFTSRENSPISIFDIATISAASVITIFTNHNDSALSISSIDRMQSIAYLNIYTSFPRSPIAIFDVEFIDCINNSIYIASHSIDSPVEIYDVDYITTGWNLDIVTQGKSSRLSISNVIDISCNAYMYIGTYGEISPVDITQVDTIQASLALDIYSHQGQSSVALNYIGILQAEGLFIYASNSTLDISQIDFIISSDIVEIYTNFDDCELTISDVQSIRPHFLYIYTEGNNSPVDISQITDIISEEEIYIYTFSQFSPLNLSSVDLMNSLYFGVYIYTEGPDSPVTLFEVTTIIADHFIEIYSEEDNSPLSISYADAYESGDDVAIYTNGVYSPLTLFTINRLFSEAELEITTNDYQSPLEATHIRILQADGELGLKTYFDNCPVTIFNVTSMISGIFDNIVMHAAGIYSGMFIENVETIQSGSTISIYTYGDYSDLEIFNVTTMTAEYDIRIFTNLQFSPLTVFNVTTMYCADDIIIYTYYDNCPLNISNVGTIDAGYGVYIYTDLDYSPLDLSQVQVIRAYYYVAIITYYDYSPLQISDIGLINATVWEISIYTQDVNSPLVMYNVDRIYANRDFAIFSGSPLQMYNITTINTNEDISIYTYYNSSLQMYDINTMNATSDIHIYTSGDNSPLQLYDINTMNANWYIEMYTSDISSPIEIYNITTMNATQHILIYTYGFNSPIEIYNITTMSSNGFIYIYSYDNNSSITMGQTSLNTTRDIYIGSNLNSSEITLFAMDIAGNNTYIETQQPNTTIEMTNVDISAFYSLWISPKLHLLLCGGAMSAMDINITSPVTLHCPMASQPSFLTAGSIDIDGPIRDIPTSAYSHISLQAQDVMYDSDITLMAPSSSITFAVDNIQANSSTIQLSANTEIAFEPSPGPIRFPNATYFNATCIPGTIHFNHFIDAPTIPADLTGNVLVESGTVVDFLGTQHRSGEFTSFGEVIGITNTSSTTTLRGGNQAALHSFQTAQSRNRIFAHPFNASNGGLFISSLSFDTFTLTVDVSSDSIYSRVVPYAFQPQGNRTIHLEFNSFNSSNVNGVFHLLETDPLVDWNTLTIMSNGTRVYHDDLVFGPNGERFILKLGNTGFDPALRALSLQRIPEPSPSSSGTPSPSKSPILSASISSAPSVIPSTTPSLVPSLIPSVIASVPLSPLPPPSSSPIPSASALPSSNSPLAAPPAPSESPFPFFSQSSAARSGTVSPVLSKSPSNTPPLAATNCNGPCGAIQATQTVLMQQSGNTGGNTPITIVLELEDGTHVGTVTFPPDLSTSDLTLDIVVSENDGLVNGKGPSGEVSLASVVDITLRDEFGNEITSFNSKLEICLNNNNAGDDNCLAYYSKTKSTWVCEDECLDTSGDLSCGETDHLTSFALLLGGGGDEEACGGSTDYLITWLSLAFVAAAICCIIFVIVLVEVQFQRKRFLFSRELTRLGNTAARAL